MTTRLYTAKQRSDMLRGRVADAIQLMGIGDEDYGIRMFAKRCVSYGEAHKLRTWTDRTRSAEYVGTGSIRNLIGARQGATLRCDHWVLDLFEGVLGEMYHSPKRVRSVPDPMDDLLADEPSGVQTFAVEAPAVQDKPLSEALLEAYLRRDDDAFLDLCQRVRQLSS